MGALRDERTSVPCDVRVSSANRLRVRAANDRHNQRSSALLGKLASSLLQPRVLRMAAVDTSVAPVAPTTPVAPVTSSSGCSRWPRCADHPGNPRRSGCPRIAPCPRWLMAVLITLPAFPALILSWLMRETPRSVHPKGQKTVPWRQDPADMAGPTWPGSGASSSLVAAAQRTFPAARSKTSRHTRPLIGSRV